jgi:hypothetical protein
MCEVCVSQGTDRRICRNMIALLLWLKKQGAHDFHISNFPTNLTAFTECVMTYPNLMVAVEVSRNRFIAQITPEGEAFLSEHAEDVALVREKYKGIL